MNSTVTPTTPPTQTPYDCIVVGGGLGAFFAYALASPSCKVALIDPIPTPKVAQEDFDSRALALSLSSIHLLKSLNIWDKVAPFATPIQGVHTSRKGRFGATRMKAAEHNLPAFGQVVALQKLYQTIRTLVTDHPQVTVFCPAKVTDFKLARPHNTVTLETQNGETHTLKGALLVGADGTQSFVRTQCNIATEVHDYGQQAILSNIALEHPHQGQAFERFTEAGLLAVLPHGEKRCKVVHCVNPAEAEALLALDDEAYLKILQHTFGYRLGPFLQVGKRVTYPVKRTLAKTQIRPGMVLLGNSAHTIHPVAAQGFNLGLRDMAVLREVVLDALSKGQNPGDASLLQNYVNRTHKNQSHIIQFTHTLLQTYTATHGALVTSLGLMALDKFPSLQRHLTKLTLGFSAPASDLLLEASLHD